MDISIDETFLPEFLRVTNVGTVESGDFARIWEAVFGLDYWQPGINVLFDNRKLKVEGNGYELTTEAARFFMANIERIGGGKIAVLMSREENLQFGQQFNYEIGRSDQRVQYFFSESDALGWVTLDSTL